jgi:hypothetical protein
MICLDTNAVIAVLNNQISPVCARIDAAVRRGDALAMFRLNSLPVRHRNQPP